MKLYLKNMMVIYWILISLSGAWADSLRDHSPLLITDFELYATEYMKKYHGRKLESRRLVHDSDSSLLWGYCLDMNYWGTCQLGWGCNPNNNVCAQNWCNFDGQVYSNYYSTITADSLTNGCSPTASDLRCVECWSRTRSLLPSGTCNYWECSTTSLHTCNSCQPSHEGKRCPKSDSQGCNPPTGGVVYSDCNTALTSLGWTTYVKQIQNQFDTSTITLGHQSLYLTNSQPDCFVHCYSLQCKQDSGTWGCPSGFSLNKNTGVVSYNIRNPYYFSGGGLIRFWCDNGFQQIYVQFYMDIACHSDSTNITIPNIVADSHQTVAIREWSTFWPRHNTSKPVTSVSACILYPSDTNLYKTSADTLGNTLTNGLDSALYNRSTSWPTYVQVTSANRYKRGYYEYYIYTEARGGAYNWSPKLTLTVYCDDQSTTISVNNMVHTQVFEVGTNHGWYFDEFTQTTDCPIQKYRITTQTSQTTDHSSFKTPADVMYTQTAQLPNPLYRYEAAVPDTTVEATYIFKVEATALGGKLYWTPVTKVLQYMCFSNYTITSTGFYNPVQFWYKRLPGTTAKYTFQTFTVSQPLCPIIKYELDNDANSATIVSPTKARFDPTCQATQGTLCKEVLVDIDGTGYPYHSFWIVATSLGGTVTTVKVQINVDCGDEVVSFNPTGAYVVFARDLVSTTTPLNINSRSVSPTNFYDLQSVTNLACPVVLFNIYSNVQANLGVDGNITLLNPLSPSTSSLNIPDDKPIYQKIIYIQAMTPSTKTAMFKLNYTICGFETLIARYPTNKSIDNWYFYQNPEVNAGLEWVYLDSLFYYEATKTDPWCYNQTLTFWKDSACTIPWVNPIPAQVGLESNKDGTQRVHVYTNNSFSEQWLYMKRETKGGVKAIYWFAFEVCGLETVSLSSTAKQINILQWQYDCPAFVCKFSMQDYRKNFVTSSRMCIAQRFSLYQLQPNGTYTPFPDSLITIDPNNYYSLDVKTHLNFSRQLYIGTYGHANQAFLLVNVTVLKSSSSLVLEKINKPPYLSEGQVSNVTYFVTEQNFSNTKYFVQLSEFKDDMLMWQSLIVTSKEFGNITFTNGTGKELSFSGQILDYDQTTNRIIFWFSSFDYYRQFLGVHKMNVTITDKLGAKTTYITYVSFGAPAIPKPVQVMVEDTFNKQWSARIESIDKYGVTTIRFSKDIDTSLWDMDAEGKWKQNFVNSSALDVYVRPYDDWNDNLFYNNRSKALFNITKLNFTWELINITGSEMNINISFFEPHWISKQEKPDKLFIFFKNFYKKKSSIKTSKRELINDGVNVNASKFKGLTFISKDGDYFFPSNASMSIDIVSQYQQSSENWLDVSAERNKDFLKLLIGIGALIQLLGMSSSFYQITAMITTLQLAIHLPIMNFVFPSNVMVYLRALVPVVMFDVIENSPLYAAIFSNKREGDKDILNIEQQVQDLSYNLHNPLMNLGTLSLGLCILLIRLILLFVLWLPLTIRFPKRVTKIYQKEKKSLIWGSFLFIFVEGYFEVLLTAVIFFYVP